MKGLTGNWLWLIKILLIISGLILTFTTSYSQSKGEKNFWVNVSPGLGVGGGSVATMYLNGGINLALVSSVRGPGYTAAVLGVKAMLLDGIQDEHNYFNSLGGAFTAGIDAGSRVQFRINGGLAILSTTKNIGDTYGHDRTSKKIGVALPFEIGLHFMPADFLGLGITYFAILGEPVTMGAAVNLEFGKVYGNRRYHSRNSTRVIRNEIPEVELREEVKSDSNKVAVKEDTSLVNKSLREGDIDTLNQKLEIKEINETKKTNKDNYKGVVGLKVIGRNTLIGRNTPIIGLDTKFSVQKLKIEAIAGLSRKNTYPSTSGKDFSFVLLLEKNDNIKNSENFNWIRGGGIGYLRTQWGISEQKFCPSIIGGLEYTSKNGPLNISADIMFYWGSLIPSASIGIALRCAFK